jgi:lysophospholipase L1-like esterase
LDKVTVLVKENNPQRILLLLILALLSGSAAPCRAQRPGTEGLIQDGDRIVFLGATFIERMQDSGYVETELTCRLATRTVTFRNLGWSGDTVAGISRAVFGTPDQGFARLDRDVKGTRPTVVVLCYGGNEAHDGPAGLPEFEMKTRKLLENLEKLTSRIVFLAPAGQEQRPAPLPSPAAYNKNLKLYVESLRAIAAEREHRFLELGRIAQFVPGVLDLPAGQLRLTENGLHYGDRGYWVLAPGIAGRLLGPGPRWSVKLDIKQQQTASRGVSVSKKQLTAEHVVFEAVSARLPRPMAPRTFKGQVRLDRLSGPGRLLTVVGLQPGMYRLMVDGKTLQVTTSNKLAAGISLTGSWEQSQVAQLRSLIVAKNKLYFHRYRPQNETYLLLFRKHEQGNNAVELSQFDPLVKAAEMKIAALKQPRSHRFELVRQE